MHPPPPTAYERTLRALFRGVSALPAGARRVLRGPTRTNDRGDALDPDVQLMVRLESLESQDPSARTPEQARQRLLSAVRLVEGPSRPMHRIEHHPIDDDVGVRVYVPDRAPSRPVLVYAHGGGWVVGGLRTHDRLCRRLAVDGGQIVAAVDYPLAPERPYPGGLRGVTRAFRWIRDHAAQFGGDPARVAIGGDSAGGNLSAATCLALRDDGQPQPAFQLLVYPATDLRHLTNSYHVLGEGFLLTKASIAWYLRHYGADPTDPRASVFLEPELGGLCPAIVATAGFDPLRDEGEAYAARLVQAGVPTVTLGFASLVHGFANMDGAIPAADRALSAITTAIREQWANLAAPA